MTPVELVLSKLRDVKASGKGWRARCPAHDDRDPSLDICEGDGGRALVICRAECKTEDVVAAIGLTMADLMPTDGADTAKTPRAPRMRKVSSTASSRNSKTYPTARAAIAELERRHGERSALWSYHNAQGEPVGVIVRWDRPEGKDIRPVARNGSDWIIGGMAEPRPLYRLPDLADAKRIYICEGEKAAEAAWSIGLTTTTSPHGSKSAEKADWRPLSGREVVILPDNDKGGQEYASAVAAILAKLTPAPVVKLLDLPGLPEHGDIANWLEAHDAVEPETLRGQVEALSDAAEPIDPEVVTGTTGPVLVRLADVRPEAIRWLWPGRIPLGKLTLLVGDPDLGKSLLTLDLTARVSTGAPWPDAPSEPNPGGGVVLLSAEDDLGDTIRPRLDAAGADVSRVVALTAVRGLDDDGDYARSVDLSRDLDAVERAVDEVTGCRLVVVDPITAYLGRTDSYKNAEVRGLLAPLAELAGRRRVAVLAVTHLRKSGGPAVYRSMGSLAFAAAARAVWAVAKDKGDDERRLFVPVKNNLTRDRSGLAYRTVESDLPDVPHVEWEPGPVNVSADDALAAEPSEEGSALDEAVDWLRDILTDGPMKAKEVKDHARADGIAPRTLDRAKGKLGVLAGPDGVGGPWVWRLPDSPTVRQESPEYAEPETLAHCGKSGALCDEEWGEV